MRGDVGKGRQASLVLLDGDDAGGAFEEKGAGQATGAGADFDHGHGFAADPPRGRCVWSD